MTQTDRYVGKILHINAGYRLRFQYHEHKDETLYVQPRDLDMQFGPNAEHLETKRVRDDDVHYNPPGVVHRIDAITDVDMFEVSMFEVWDVVRLQDACGRTS